MAIIKWSKSKKDSKASALNTSSSNPALPTSPTSPTHKTSVGSPPVQSPHSGLKSKSSSSSFSKSPPPQSSNSNNNISNNANNTQGLININKSVQPDQSNPPNGTSSNNSHIPSSIPVKMTPFSNGQPISSPSLQKQQNLHNQAFPSTSNSQQHGSGKPFMKPGDSSTAGRNNNNNNNIPGNFPPQQQQRGQNGHPPQNQQQRYPPGGFPSNNQQSMQPRNQQGYPPFSGPNQQTQQPLQQKGPLSSPPPAVVPQYPWSQCTISNVSPFPRYGHAANHIAARDGEVFVMGGLKGSNVFGDLWVIETGMCSTRLFIDVLISRLDMARNDCKSHLIKP